MARQEKRFDSDSSDSESARQSWFPPPPTAPIRVKTVRVRETPRPVEQIPPVPTVPALLLPPPSPAFSDGPRSPLLERVRSKRRTIMERIEGWWDLELLEKRQTLFRGASSRKT
ncbi:hypothetical protein QQZ08_011894 [Neonectria magnoliae]|uniref:Uncharacterized protein n=1 Tax=Neonectria magnoliae TaxID=2732573 RepID=A0ABR1H6K7_9HYPO